MAMGGVDDDDVGASGDEGLDPLFPVEDAYRGPDTEAPQGILAGIGIFTYFFDIFDRYEAFEIVLVVHDEEFFNPMLMEELFRFFEGDIGGHCH